MRWIGKMMAMCLLVISLTALAVLGRRNEA
jgi:hypothetical protein